jgi:hypothetical protein
VTVAITPELKVALSGVDVCTVTGHGGTEGTHTLVATARDRAGSTSTSQLAYTVVAAQKWTLKGFAAPIGERARSRSAWKCPPGPSASTVWQTATGGSGIPLIWEAFVNGVERTATTDVTSSWRSGSAAALVQARTASTSWRGGLVEPALRLHRRPVRAGLKTPTVSDHAWYRASVTTRDGSSVHTFVRLRT